MDPVPADGKDAEEAKAPSPPAHAGLAATKQVIDGANFIVTKQMHAQFVQWVGLPAKESKSDLPWDSWGDEMGKMFIAPELATAWKLKIQDDVPRTKKLMAICLMETWLLDHGSHTDK